MKIPTLAVVPFVALTGSLVLFPSRALSSTLLQRAHTDPTDGAHQTPAAPSPVAETQRPGRDAGSGETAAVSGLPDVVPLPEPAVHAAGANGDVLVSPASGDPYFLGFAAGKHYPPANERIDPDLIRSVRSFYDDGRPQQTTYAFVMMQRRITPERVAELESLGVRVLGFHPHYCLKVALPTSAIDLVAAHPAVRWVGVAKDWQKVHPMLTAQLSTAKAGDSVDVWINLFESDLGPDSRSELEGTLEEAGPGGITHSFQDQSQGARRWMSHGWQQRALQQAGLEVVEYVDSLRAFRARLAPSALSMVTALDCVQFVEPVLAEESLHDESIPLIHSDATRGSYSGGTNSVAIIGQIDTGLFNGHLGLNQLWGIGSDFTGSGTGPWMDECGHGSHVAGTITGDASVDASLAGNAPGLGWGATGRYFNAKWLVNASPKCISNSALSGPLNFMHTPFTDMNGNVTPIPHVVNNSWGASGVFFGTEATPRAIDDEVYSHDQMYVFSWDPLESTCRHASLSIL